MKTFAVGIKGSKEPIYEHKDMIKAINRSLKANSIELRIGYISKNTYNKDGQITKQKFI